MAPPSWAKEFVLSSGRRLQGGHIYDNFFSDDTDASILMRAHLFYLCSLVALVLCSHKAYYVFCKWKGFEIQAVLSAPGVEIQIFLALFMVKITSLLLITTEEKIMINC